MQNESAQNTSTEKAPDTARIMLTLPRQLLERLDEAAKQDYTTRSGLIRQALLWYLRPQGRQHDQSDPDAIYKTLQHRKQSKELKKLLHETSNIDVYDG
jgi:metal-responsive CopG/Arc/MetJ family transcriptional regulator